MRGRRLIDSCILASTVTQRPPIQLRTELLPPSWIEPSSLTRVVRLLADGHVRRGELAAAKT